MTALVVVTRALVVVTRTLVVVARALVVVALVALVIVVVVARVVILVVSQAIVGVVRRCLPRRVRCRRCHHCFVFIGTVGGVVRKRMKELKKRGRRTCNRRFWSTGSGSRSSAFVGPFWGSARSSALWCVVRSWWLRINKHVM